MRERKTFVLVWLLFVSSLLLGQQEKIDSLKVELGKAKSNDEKLLLNNQISELYFDGQIYLDSSYFYAQNAYGFARKSNNRVQKSRVLLNMGLLETEFKNFDKALNYLSQAKEEVVKEDSAILLSIIYSNIGGVYLENENFPLALENYHKALEISKKERDTIGVAIDLINLGEIHYKAGNYLQSKEDLEYSLSLLESVKDSFASAYLNYGKTLFALGNNSKAKIYGHKAYEISLLDKSGKGILESAQFLSDLYHAENRDKQALSYLKEAAMQKEILNDAKELNEIEKLKLNLALSKKERELERMSQGGKYKTIISILGTLGVVFLLLLISRQMRIRSMKAEIYKEQEKLFNIEVETISEKKKRFKAFYSGKEQSSDLE